MTQTEKDKAVLVTGGADRIGKAICLYLASNGYDIALHCNKSKAKARRTAQQIKALGRRCEIFSCDLSNEKNVTTLIKQVTKKFISLNLLINNASIFEPSTLKSATLLSLKYHMSINFNAPFLLTKDFANICRKGQIINILDTHIIKNQSKHSTYLLSKKALYNLTQLAAVELAPKIRVNGIAPGLILPPTGKGKTYLKRLAHNIPLKKVGKVEFITQSIKFLLENSYLTGQIIFNDGGEHLV